MQSPLVQYRALRVSGQPATQPEDVRVIYTLVTHTEVPATIVDNLTARELIAWLAWRGLLPAGASYEAAVVANLRVTPRRVPVE